MKILIAIAWVLVALDGIVLLVALFARNMGDDAAGRGVGTTIGAIGLSVVAVAAAALYFSARAHSWVGVGLAGAFLALPLLFLFGTAGTSALQELHYRISAGRTGRYQDSQQRELAAAIRTGNLERMRSILAQKPNLAGRDPIGYDLLSYAVMTVQQNNGSVEAVRMLLDAGFDPNQSRTPADLNLVNDLAYTSDPKVKEIYRLLLEHHADPNVLHRQTQRLPLGVAEDLDLVKLLVAHGADVNWSGAGGTPLIHAILTSHWDIAIYLLGHGANPALADKEGTTPASALERFQKDDGSLPEGAQRVKAALETH
ncbi:MAG: ankyrin repeat domain-containing protein [Acidobacteriia bacterium]|nr:ankyrin repeat domain-containing protein [Terriglobia bacterium]